jgi:hypothetical protein
MSDKGFPGFKRQKARPKASQVKIFYQWDTHLINTTLLKGFNQR